MKINATVSTKRLVNTKNGLKWVVNAMCDSYKAHTIWLDETSPFAPIINSRDNITVVVEQLGGVGDRTYTKLYETPELRKKAQEFADRQTLFSALEF